MPDETNIQRILTYLEQQRGDYPLDVLREQLRLAGYAPEDIEAAFARLPEQAAPVVPPAQSASVEPTQQPTPASVATPAPQPEQRAPVEPSPNAEPEIRRMVAYLRQHRDRYSLDSLRAQLLGTGQPPELVEAAVARVRAEMPVHTGSAWPLGLAVAILNLLAVPLLLYFLVILADQLFYSSTAGLLIFSLWPLTLVGELIAGLILRNGPRDRQGRILLYGVLFSVVIPIVLVILLLGVCLILVGAGAIR